MNPDEEYNEQDSIFYCPPKPKDYYTSTGIWEMEPANQETKSSSSSGLAEMLGKIIPPLFGK